MNTFKYWVRDFARREAQVSANAPGDTRRAFVEADEAAVGLNLISTAETARALVTQAVSMGTPGAGLDNHGRPIPPILMDRRPPRGSTRMYRGSYQRFDGIMWVTDEHITAQLNKQGTPQALSDEQHLQEEG